MMVGGAGCLACPPITVWIATLALHTAAMVTGRRSCGSGGNQSETGAAAGTLR